MLKKLLVTLSLLYSPLLMADRVNDLIETNINPLSVNVESQSGSIVFKPFTVDTQKCEIDFNADLDILGNSFKEQFEGIWESIKQDSTYFAQQLANKAKMEALIKVPTYMDFMIQKGSTEIMAKVTEEISLCVNKTTTKATEIAAGGGGGDQAGTMKVGVNPKELLGVIECYQEALYPSNMTDDDIVLLNQIEEKWKKIISGLLYGQLNIMLENFVVERNNNVCTNLTTKKQENLAYLVDLLENQKIVLLNNKSINASVYFEIAEQENKELGVALKKDAAEITQVEINKDSIATQPLFIDMEPASFDLFKKDLEVYMVKLSKGFGLYLNEDTMYFLEEVIIDQIFNDSAANAGNLSSNWHTLIMTLSNSPYFFYNRYGNSDIDFHNVKLDIVKEVLNKGLLYAYSKGEHIREQKLKIYYANVQQFIQVNNRFLLQILLLDRYMFRYKEKVGDTIVKNIITKKEIEKEIFFRDFCLANRYEIYDELCGRI